MLSYPLGGKIDPPAIPALFDLFLNHLFAVDFKLRFSGERRLFHREGDVRKVIFLGVTLLVLRRNYCDKIVKKTETDEVEWNRLKTL
jgi:hypothetical protein